MELVPDMLEARFGLIMANNLSESMFFWELFVFAVETWDETWH